MFYDPYEHAEQLGIEVVHRPIRTANGMWIPDHNLIVIRSGMKARYDRSILAHELGHATYGHRDDRPKHEVQADRFAAEHMVDATALKELMTWVPDSSKLALELDVSPRLLRVYLNVHRLAA